MYDIEHNVHEKNPKGMHSETRTPEWIKRECESESERECVRKSVVLYECWSKRRGVDMWNRLTQEKQTKQEISPGVRDRQHA